MKIINLTAHRATEAQKQAGVIDLPELLREDLLELLTFSEIPTNQEMKDRAYDVAQIAIFNDLGADDGDDPMFNKAMIGSGIPAFNRYLEEALLSESIEPLYAFSLRHSTEFEVAGNVRKESTFDHSGFVRPYQDRFPS